ncbi:MAG: hypothetical protein AAGK17_07550, partial [Pseudomonadota bacterium]
MSQKLKVILGIPILGGWGLYLLYAWAVPSAVPEWAMSRATRKAFMLSREFEPTFFTLMFGVMFTGITLFGIFRLA